MKSLKELEVGKLYFPNETIWLSSNTKLTKVFPKNSECFLVLSVVNFKPLKYKILIKNEIFYLYDCMYNTYAKYKEFPLHATEL